jgi:hypothetical protein
MEQQFPEVLRIMKEQIKDYLLSELYIGQGFALERSRTLIRKCRDLRRKGFEGLPSCIEYISEAVTTLVYFLNSKLFVV